MELLPYPLSPAARRVRGRRLQQRLQNIPLNDLLEEDLRTLLDWEAVRDPLQRRLCRNAGLIYSRAELKHALLAHYQMLLGHAPAGGPHG